MAAEPLMTGGDLRAGRAGGNGPVLIVEDHTSFAQAVRVVFEGAGVGPVAFARTAGDAIEKILQTDFSLVVTDLELPDRPGEKVVDLCLERKIAVVILSAYAKPDAVVRWAQAGVHGFLHKSVDLDRLIEVCDAARRGLKAFDVDQLLRSLDAQEDQGAKIGLSARERGIIELLAEGVGTRDIAATTYLSQETVRTYIKRILAKLGAHSRLEAVARARELGLLGSTLNPQLGTRIEPK